MKKKNKKIRKLSFEQKKKKVLALLEQMDWFFSTKNHERNIGFSKVANESNSIVAADITMDERYSRLTIKIYPIFWDHTESEQRMFLLHEMCHMLVRPVQYEAQQLFDGNLRTQDQINFSIENATSRIAIILDALLCDGRLYMKKEYKKYITQKSND